jgi:hypothetical protein
MYRHQYNRYTIEILDVTNCPLKDSGKEQSLNRITCTGVAVQLLGSNSQENY